MTKKRTNKGGSDFTDAFVDQQQDPRHGIGETRELKPRNQRQKEYMSCLNDNSASIVFALGPAGTGKTLLAVHKAIEEYKAKNIKTIVITRPAVTVDEEHGFLPGDLIEKMAPWMRPVMDIFKEHFTKPQIDTMLRYEFLEISPLAYMRGRTFKDSFIIADEMQNSTMEQMKMLLTRIGDRSRMVVTGDLDQHDRKDELNGLADFTDRLAYGDLPKSIREVRFDHGHIERHPVVTQVLDVYGDY